jgi:hypothetical protein
MWPLFTGRDHHIGEYHGPAMHRQRHLHRGKDEHPQAKSRQLRQAPSLLELPKHGETSERCLYILGFLDSRASIERMIYLSIYINQNSHYYYNDDNICGVVCLNCRTFVRSPVPILSLIEAL